MPAGFDAAGIVSAPEHVTTADLWPRTAPRRWKRTVDRDHLPRATAFTAPTLRTCGQLGTNPAASAQPQAKPLVRNKSNPRADATSNGEKLRTMDEHQQHNSYKHRARRAGPWHSHSPSPRSCNVLMMLLAPTGETGRESSPSLGNL